MYGTWHTLAMDQGLVSIILRVDKHNDQLLVVTRKM